MLGQQEREGWGRPVRRGLCPHEEHSSYDGDVVPRPWHQGPAFGRDPVGLLEWSADTAGAAAWSAREGRSPPLSPGMASCPTVAALVIC